MKTEERIMAAITKFICQRYRLIPLLTVVLIILSLIAANNIEVKTEIKDLLPSDYPQVQSYEEIDDLFSGGATVMITIEGSDKERMTACADAFVEQVRNDENIMQYVRAIDLKLDRDFVNQWGLLLQKAKDLEKTGQTFSELNLLPFITSLNNSFEETYTGDGADEDLETNRQENEAVASLSQMETFFTLLHDYLKNPEQIPVSEQGRLLAETFIYGDEYGFNHDNTMLLFTITPDFNIVEIEKIVDMMSGIKAIQKNIQREFPDLKVGYTGDVAIQGDEQDALSFDMLVPAVVALVLILILFIFSFSQLRSIIFILITLVIGIIFNYGFVGVTIKEINMLTSIMAVLLIGLGVDYGIQIVTNFNTYREDGLAPEEALTNTYKRAGMGTLLAALTTALAFFVMSATGSHAFSQFGIIMGTGIINCFVAMIFILPSILLWWGKKDLQRKRLPQINYRFLAAIGNFTHRHSSRTLLIGVVVTALLAWAISLNRMEYDLMTLEPQDMPSMIQYNRVMEKFDITPFASMVVADDIEQAREFTRQLERTPLVAEVNSVSYLMPSPEEQQERLAEIRKIHAMPKRYRDYRYDVKTMEEFAYEVQRIEWNVIEIGDLSVAGLGEDNKILKKRNAMVREIFGAEVGRPGKEVFQKLIELIETDPALYARRLNDLDPYFAREMDRLVSAMSAVSRPMTLDDLPKSITSGMIAEDGQRNLVMIYPDKGILEHVDKIQTFNDVVGRVSPRITGSTQILTVWMDEVNRASVKAALFIFGAVFLFLMLTFRNLKYSLFACTPLILGLVWMLGLYPLLGQKINVINIAVIPLVIGMGIDFGIHIAHRYRVERDINIVYRYTGKGVFLSAFTTMIGFGSLGLIGKFGSIASMGSILFVGIASCLLTTLLLLPALLSLDKSKHMLI